MGTLRAVTAADLITKARYELRDTNTRVFEDAELLRYLNKSCDVIYSLLIDLESDMVLTGSENFNTVAGTETYDKAAQGFDDIWTMNQIWVDTYPPMEQVEESERYDYVNQEEAGNTGGRSIPEKYYFAGDNVGLLPIPDDVYTIRLTYYPNFVPLASTSATVPFKNLFNLELVESLLIFAKNRNQRNFNLNEALLNIFSDRAKRIVKKRRVRNVSIRPVYS